MKLGKSLLTASVLAVSLSASLPAAAVDLIGDTLQIDRRYPDIATLFSGWENPTVTLTPAVGTADAVVWDSGGGRFDVQLDGDATTIAWRFPIGSSFLTSPTMFDGFVITGFSHDILSATILSNDSGYSVAASTLSPRSLALALNGYGIDGGGYVLEVIYQPIPEPSTWVLMAAGLFGGLALRRRRA